MGDEARFKRDMQNFEKAASRITATAGVSGGTEPAALMWLLGFLSNEKQDVARLNDWQRDEAFWNVYQFAWDGGQGYGSDMGRMGSLSLAYPETDAERTAAITHIQREARAALEDFVNTGVGTFPKGEGAFVVLARGPSTLRYSGRALAASFHYMAAHLLSRYAHRVKRCEGCPLIMLAGRKDQRFHSQSCQITSFIRKKRAKEKAKQAKAGKKTKKTTDRARHKGGTRHANR